MTICQLLCSRGREFGIKVLPGVGSSSLIDFLISTNSKKKPYGTCTLLVKLIEEMFGFNKRLLPLPKAEHAEESELVEKSPQSWGKAHGGYWKALQGI